MLFKFQAIISIMKGVKELDLTVCMDLPFRLPASIFTCKTLEVLKIQGCISIKVPRVVCLPKMRYIKLERVQFEDCDSVGMLISSCTSLEYLVIDNEWEEGDPFIFSSSCLRVLKYNCVQSFDLGSAGWDFQLDSCNIARSVLSCKKLEELELSYVAIRYPSRICVPNVRVLKLCSVVYESDESAWNFISSFSSLESLVIDYLQSYNISKLKISSSTLKEFKILQDDLNGRKAIGLELDAPALLYLELRHWIVKGIKIKRLPSLVKASIVVGSRDDHHSYSYGQDICRRSICDLYHGLCNVKMLYLSHRAMRAIIPGNELPMFPRLTTLKLEAECCEWSLLPQFIKNSNILEELIFNKFCCCKLPNNKHMVSWRDPESVPECFLSSFQRMSFYGFEGLEGDLSMVEYILKNTRVMRKMVIENYKDDLLQKLLNFHRGSAECEMVVGLIGTIPYTDPF